MRSNRWTSILLGPNDHPLVYNVQAVRLNAGPMPWRFQVRQHFSEHFLPTQAETIVVWAEAVFVFDTNVLLNLYRVSHETSLAIREILKTLKGRLFLPHQIGVEFFRHREREIAEQVNAFERVRQALNKIPQRFNQEFSRHPCIPIAGIVTALQECIDGQIAVVNESQQANQLNFLSHDDPILAELDALFANASECAYVGAENDTLNKKVDDRIAHNLPPCYVPTGGKATAPSGSNPHRGDGRVWFQIVKHAETTKKPIVFVTGDEKPNWWRTARLGNQDRAIGPHFELIRDLESVSQNRFLMYTQEQFLAEAPKYLAVPPQAQAIDEVRQIRESATLDKDTSLVDEPKASPGDDASSSQVDAELEKDLDLLEEQKNSPLEELKSDESVQSDEEVD